MAILSIFKSFEKYIPIDGNWQLASERTAAKDIISDDGTNAEDNIQTIKNNITIINSSLPFTIEIDDVAKTINFIDR